LGHLVHGGAEADRDRGIEVGHLDFDLQLGAPILVEAHTLHVDGQVATAPAVPGHEESIADAPAHLAVVSLHRVLGSIEAEEGERPDEEDH